MIKLNRRDPTYILPIGLISLAVVFTSCLPSIIRKAPPGKHYVISHEFEVKGGNFRKQEKNTLTYRLSNQIEDSLRINERDILFLLSIIRNPPAMDTAAVSRSIANMKASLFHAGYYRSTIQYRADTSGRKVKLKYLVNTGTPTRIEKIDYRLVIPEMQRVADGSSADSRIKLYQPISKLAVLEETARLVDSFRNHGFYKFTNAEIRVIGDTTSAALTTISDDPFAQLELLATEQNRSDSPRIRISVNLNPPSDSSKLLAYRIRSVEVFSDFSRKVPANDTAAHTDSLGGIRIISERQLFNPEFILKNIFIKPGNLYREDDFNRTVNALSRSGVWQSVGINIKEAADSATLLDVQLELIPNKKLGFEAALEASYLSSNSATSVLAGNLLGLSMNLSLSNRNLWREGIRMRHGLRTGIELNNNRGINTPLVSAQEVGYSNSVLIPKLIFPGLASILNKSGETFINGFAGFNNRVNLFNLQTFSLNFGWNAPYRRNPSWKVSFRPLNFEFNLLFNETDSFRNILLQNPFLRYSYNTSYVTGMSFSLSHFQSKGQNGFRLGRERALRFNVEESGLTWGNLPIAVKYLRRFVKIDGEWRYTIKYSKTVLAFRSFMGVGITLLESDSNRTLPFFKQYFAGGVNSMRGWPARGLGIGGQRRIPYNSTATLFNDRTGDIQLEANAEYRYDIAKIIPNTLTLRGAVFVDIGNIWNLRSITPGMTDTAQFRFKNLYKQLAVSAGTGFRIDFNYVVLRLDLGFRFKRPDLFYQNAGWKAPDIGFDDFIKKLFTRGENGEFREWRYNNFNFGVGISYPF